jgi:hypothetical protein
LPTPRRAPAHRKSRLLAFFKYKIRSCQYMSLGYADAIAQLWGGSVFTTREFSGRLGSLRPSQTLSELKTRGIIARVARGEYRLLGPEERPDLRAEEWRRVRTRLLGSGLPMAWTGAEAVGLWTGWRYRVSPSVFYRDFAIEVPRRSLSAWREFLKLNRISTDRRRRVGAVVTLVPTVKFSSARHRGEPVISRESTIRLIRAHRGVYAEADGLVER